MEKIAALAGLLLTAAFAIVNFIRNVFRELDDMADDYLSRFYD